MGTEVLLPQDLLGERLRGPAQASSLSLQRRRNFPANTNLTRLVVNKRTTNGRKTVPRSEKKRSNAKNDGAKKPDARGKDEGRGGGGHVTLLRRGESLDSLILKKEADRNVNSKPKAQPADDLAVLGTARIRQESPEMMPNKIFLSLPPLPSVYAGSAFSLSPSPNSLPVPSFCNKKQENDSIAVTNSATRDLRRLLRLD